MLESDADQAQAEKELVEGDNAFFDHINELILNQLGPLPEKVKSASSKTYSSFKPPVNEYPDLDSDEGGPFQEETMANSHGEVPVAENEFGNHPYYNILLNAIMHDYSEGDIAVHTLHELANSFRINDYPRLKDLNTMDYIFKFIASYPGLIRSLGERGYGKSWTAFEPSDENIAYRISPTVGFYKEDRGFLHYSELIFKEQEIAYGLDSMYTEEIIVLSRSEDHHPEYALPVALAYIVKKGKHASEGMSVMCLTFEDMKVCSSSVELDSVTNPDGQSIDKAVYASVLGRVKQLLNLANLVR